MTSELERAIEATLFAAEEPLSAEALAGHLGDAATGDVRETLKRLEPVAAKLGCSAELADVEKIIERGAGYQRQRRVAAEHGGDLRAVVLDLVKQMRQGPDA